MWWGFRLPSPLPNFLCKIYLLITIFRTLSWNTKKIKNKALCNTILQNFRETSRLHGVLRLFFEKINTLDVLLENPLRPCLCYLTLRARFGFIFCQLKNSWWFSGYPFVSPHPGPYKTPVPPTLCHCFLQRYLPWYERKQLFRFGSFRGIDKRWKLRIFRWKIST